MLKSLLFIFCTMLIVSNAQALPFDKGNPDIGKKMVAENCISCHASSFGGDGSGIYTREDRKVKTSSGLLTQIRFCSTMLNLKWFEDEELNVASYLNKNYYKFEK
ncbi:cytochrome c [Methyloradius palustris]|uniref:Cytochrome c domain-containing protein n=1 Tax=Methyloradius palustris TaxID=2778876 RepID=A0A8D5JYS1_9PROT|nr:hypothetical protein ZMTM_12310 [Methyloradius palustris]